VFNTLGRMPRRGESIHVPGYEIVVADLSRNRVSRVQIIEKRPSRRPRRRADGRRRRRHLP
jgi:CBS domain containing-hemolysin-like protein